MEQPFTPAFFRRLQHLKIHTRRAFLGSRQGIHRSPRKGHGLEFHDFRPYAPGDDFRHIDWGVYGRSDRLYVRQFREEQDLNVTVLLDASASMAYPHGKGKFELAKNLALALGFTALTDGDAVTFCALGQRSTPRFSGARAISRAAQALSDISPKGSFDLLTELRAAVARQRIPGKCFFISDFLLEVSSTLSALDFLRSRNFEVTLVQVLAPSELELDFSGASQIIDAETGAELELALDGASKREYALELASHIGSLEEYCTKAGMVHLLVSSNESISDIVLMKFPEVGILK